MEQEPGREWEGQAPGTGQLDRGMDIYGTGQGAGRVKGDISLGGCND